MPNHASNPSEAPASHRPADAWAQSELTPTLFTRNNRPLRAILLETQAWFCARDLGRLMGLFIEECAVRKLDVDQTRVLPLNNYGEIENTLMLSESGMYSMIHHHFHPENRSLRRWLSTEVIPMLMDRRLPTTTEQPTLSILEWPGPRLCLLYWQSEPWVRLRDVPEMLPMRPEGIKSVKEPWWRRWV